MGQWVDDGLGEKVYIEDADFDMGSTGGYDPNWLPDHLGGGSVGGTGDRDNSWTTGGASGNAEGETGALSSIIKSLGLTGKDGNLDWAKILGLGGAAASLFGGQDYNPKSPRDLLAMQPSNAPPAFSGAQMAAMSAPLKAGNQLTRTYAADMPTPIRTGYAEGGEVQGPLSALVQGPGGGQDDMVDAALSPGEYIFDAESVSMLGDGDNAAGARKLDELRQQLRAHKRSAPPGEIAEPTGPLSQYMGGGNG